LGIAAPAVGSAAAASDAKALAKGDAPELTAVVLQRRKTAVNPAPITHARGALRLRLRARSTRSTQRPRQGAQRGQI